MKHTNPQYDLARVSATLGVPALSRLIQRLRKRYEQGRRKPTGAVTLSNPSAAEREAVDGLLGRCPSSGNPLVIQLDQLDQVVRASGFAPDLYTAVDCLVGPIPDRRRACSLARAAWDTLYDNAAERLVGRPELTSWLAELCATGLLKRTVAGDVESARQLLHAAMTIAALLPHPGTTLSQLAARTTGDAHALDRGSRLTSLLGGLLSQLSGVDKPLLSAARFRRAWDRIGIACDELSSSVLVLNLRADPDNLTGSMLNTHSKVGAPIRMVLRSLLRHPPQWNHDASADCVYVCENPSIVALAADHLAAASQPLICTEGQPSTAVRLLLQELSRLGVRLYYHGDFDWPGIRIANQMVQQFNALPWRMAAADYRHATMHASLPLTGSPVEALWDSDLCQAMMTTKLAVHEEQVVEILLRDLETVTKTHDATKRSTTPTDRTR